MLSEFIGANDVTDSEGSSKSDGVVTQAVSDEMVTTDIKKSRKKYIIEPSLVESY